MRQADAAEKRNHHAHVLLTMRAIEGDGFGAKVRVWNDTARLEAWRASWADHVNRALAAAGESARVDHRSLEAQGIDRLAQIQIGPAVVEMEARGITTDRGDMAREIEAINATLLGIGEPVRAAQKVRVTLASAHDLVRRRRRGGIFAAFRAATRHVWERVQLTVCPAPSWRWMLQRRLVRPEN